MKIDFNFGAINMAPNELANLKGQDSSHIISLNTTFVLTRTMLPKQNHSTEARTDDAQSNITA